MIEAMEPGALVTARGRPWVMLPGSRPDRLLLRPLAGGEAQTTLILPALESEPPRPARFEPPRPDRMGSSADALLLADALRLALRRGAGPFRSAGAIAFEPRAYQLAPLVMALRMETVRLLIADDVGVGKTIEAGLILREFMDRGEAQKAAILCPPHLAEQWAEELRVKFDLVAQPVTAATARRLEQGLGPRESLFDAYPLTVISLDYIKSDRRRLEFQRACPDFVIVDEAHAAVGTGVRGASQRRELLAALAAKAERHLVLLTATPHSGDAEAFHRLLGLLKPEFGTGEALAGAARERLSRHFIQRRRADVRDEGWEGGEGRARLFPRHEKYDDCAYELDGPHLAFHDAILDYCAGVTAAAGESLHKRRLAFWGTLALMRCVGSSAAAALSALRARRSGRAAEEGESEEEALEGAVFDERDEGLAHEDLEPSALADAETMALDKLIAQGEALVGRPDPKLEALCAALRPMLEKGARPVVFCRFIATAEALGAALERRFKGWSVEVVTGRLPGSERAARVEGMAAAERRILVATDCLSEGVNLQRLFDMVVHYDLSWNPTRHQQREGRVDRFGQPSPVVRSLTLYAANSAIDGAVLEVILKKAEAIERATGVKVALPSDKDKISDALMRAMDLRRKERRQMTLDLEAPKAGGPGVAELSAALWRDAEETARKSQTIFAQRRLKPEEVLPEWRRSLAHLGGAEEAERFVRRAFAKLGAALDETRGGFIAHLESLPDAARAALKERGYQGARKIAFDPSPPEGYEAAHRAHPVASVLAGRLAEAALLGAEGREGLARAGAWRAPGAERMITLALLRLRHRIGRKRAAAHEFLLAEEITPVAFAGDGVAAPLIGPEALAHLERPASDLPEAVRRRQVERALERLAVAPEALAAIARSRAAALEQDHERLRAARGGEGAATVVTPVLPPDLIGVWVILPEQAP